MKFLALIQARMGSSRLPGKVLRPARGRPMLSYLIERLRRAEMLSDIVVATTRDSVDDAIEDWCRSEGAACVRGEVNDVAARLLAVAEGLGAERFVRVSGDSPLLDPALVEEGCRLMAAESWDLVTNVFPRSFPTGQSVEVVRTAALRAILHEASVEEREHVTLFFYRNAQRFRIRNFAAPADWSYCRLAVDTADDFAELERLLDAMSGEHAAYGLADLVALAADRARTAPHG